MRYALLTVLVVLSSLFACAGNPAATAANENVDAPGTMVWGYVDDGCQLLEGAVVRFRCETCEQDWPKAVTDDRGIYTIPGDIPPTHLYHHVTGVASCEGYLPATVEFTSWPGSPTLVSFTLQPDN